MLLYLYSVLTGLNKGAFINCTNLSNVTIPGNVTTIGVQAFAYCTTFTEITIPLSVRSMEREVFIGCTSLTKINCEAESWKAVSGGWYINWTGLTEDAVKINWNYKGN